MGNIHKIIDEYPEHYCLFLEAAYSDGMMSEGGAEAIENMFSGINLQDKNMLEIGFGLGGAAFYLAEKFNASIEALEINPWMVKEATQRTPEHLKNNVKFLLYDKMDQLGVDDNAFDIAYSKGVLTHVEDKLSLFQSVYKALKPDGLFVIDDWLSPKKNQWGPTIKKICEVDNLSLYAETEDSYKGLLEEAGFTNTHFRDENKNYQRYNESIVNKLKSKEYSELFIKKFGQAGLNDAIKSYQLIAYAIKANELLIRTIQAQK